MIEFKTLLKTARKAKDFTAEQLAQRAGVRTGIVNRAEQGANLPSPHNTKRLEAALDITDERLTIARRNELTKRGKKSDPERAQARGVLEWFKSLSPPARRAILSDELRPRVTALLNRELAEELPRSKRRVLQ